jgi:hypothetical protein
MKKQRTPWIVVHDGHDGGGFRYKCRRCGRQAPMEVPIEAEMFCAIGKVFDKKHRRCRVTK